MPVSVRKRRSSDMDIRLPSTSDDTDEFVTADKGKKLKLKSLTQPAKNTTENKKSDLGYNCVFCNDSCETTEAIQCLLCKQNFHLSCCGVKPEMFVCATQLCNLLGYVCVGCRTCAAATLSELQRDVALLKSSQEGYWGTSSVPDNRSEGNYIHVSTGSLPTALPPTDASHTGHSGNSTARAHSGLTKNVISNMINSTIRDSDRRKKNVVVSGLREDTGTNDQVIITDLFTFHLGAHSSFNITSVKRLGKLSGAAGNNSRPRKTLVALSTEQEATMILKHAKNLRASSDPSVANWVFLNPDLNKDEARLAFEKRQQRRNLRLRDEGSNNAGVTTPGVRSVAPISIRTSFSNSTSTAVQSTPSPCNPFLPTPLTHLSPWSRLLFLLPTIKGLLPPLHQLLYQ